MSESGRSTEAAAPVAPKTPNNPKTISGVKSTPYAVSSTATAAASGVPRGTARADAMQFLVGDLQATEEVHFDTLVGVLLKDVAHPSEASTKPEELFQKVLGEATQLCNPPTGEKAGAVFEARKLITEGLTEYCDASSEITRYPPFVQLSNGVLDLLAEPGQFKDLLRNTDPSSILFHINHPQDITSTINGDKITRRPDIVIIAEASARAAFAVVPGYLSTLPCAEIMCKAATETILSESKNQRRQFPPEAILCSMEFKKIQKKMESPPILWPMSKCTTFSPAKVIVQDDLLVEMRMADERLAKESEMSAPVSATTNPKNPSTGAVSGTTASTGDNHSSASRKRKALDTGSQAGSKKPRTGTPIYPAIVQSASYALESINRAAGVMKVIGMIVEDGTLWIWYYDRQGAIQSHGLDWIKDFPRFVTLLAALQRFDRENWGFHHELEPDHAGPLPSPLVDNPSPLTDNPLPAAEGDKPEPRAAPKPPTNPLPAAEGAEPEPREPRAAPKPPTIIRFPAAKGDSNKDEFVVTLVGSIIHERATLLGRATRVERVTVTRGGVSIQGNWVLKVSWPESTRVSEVDILNAAVKIGDDDANVRGHLPDLLCSKDLECTTGAIREALGIGKGSEEEQMQARCGPRTPRLLVSKELHGIETLNSDDLLTAFRHIVDCHYALWTSGIKHCDISPGNMMWNPDDKYGVLNDYDLSRMNSVTPSPNLERTGTIPFLSLDLLEDILKFRQGGIEPTYKHDCDSLKWVFLYCVQKRSEMCKWLTADMEKSFAIRTTYLFSRRPFQSSRTHETLFRNGKTVFRLLQAEHYAVIEHDIAFDNGTGPEVYVGPTDLELYNLLKSRIQRLPV